MSAARRWLAQADELPTKEKHAQPATHGKPTNLHHGHKSEFFLSRCTIQLCTGRVGSALIQGPFCNQCAIDQRPVFRAESVSLLSISWKVVQDTHAAVWPANWELDSPRSWRAGDMWNHNQSGARPFCFRVYWRIWESSVPRRCS